MAEPVLKAAKNSLNVQSSLVLFITLVLALLPDGIVRYT
jgi:hypothetical protein